MTLRYRPFMILWPIMFIGSIFGANWTLGQYGIIPVGFGLVAPAGVYFAGLTFTARDMMHETLGRSYVVGGILIGGLLSYLIEPTFAVASAAAFLLSEFSDYAVYAPLRRRGWLRAVFVSNVVGVVVDSALFLWLAFGSIEFIEGLVVGKAYMTLAAIAVLFLVRKRGWRDLLVGRD